MNLLLVYLAILLVLAALFFGLSRQLGRPSGWFGFKLYSVRQLEQLLRAAGFAVEVREKARGELIVTGRPV